MDINLLVLSVGNSRLAVGTFVAGELRHVNRVAFDDRHDLPALLTRAWEPIKHHAPDAAGSKRKISEVPAAGAVVVGLSVNPARSEAIEHAAEQITGQSVRWIGRDIDLPIPVLTDDPSQTGVDRVVNVAAAYEQLGQACVVVDAGTAITVDCCSAKGEFLGGAIAPGVGVMLQALHERTARLPRVQLAPAQVEPEAIGRSTEAAIRAGLFYGVRGMVKELVEAFATQIGTWPEVIATGGDAELLFKGWELIHAVAPDLTLYGAALAYANHHIKHEG